MMNVRLALEVSWRVRKDIRAMWIELMPQVDEFSRSRLPDWSHRYATPRYDSFLRGRSTKVPSRDHSG